MLLGRRPLIGEVVAGAPLVLIALSIALAVLRRRAALPPSLHTVEHNPLQELLRSPRDAWLFALVVLVAGGVREEIQRAFLLHRFERLAGRRHRRRDRARAWRSAPAICCRASTPAIATGLLGAFWGVVYLRRRSCVAPIVSHAGFDLLQILQFLVARR